MSEHFAQRPEIGADAIYISRNSDNIALGMVSVDNGKAIIIRSPLENTYGAGYATERHHPSAVFSLIEAATIAGELLEPSKDGEEMLLSTAMTEMAADPIKSAEFRIRLESESLQKRLNTPRSDAELGVVTKDKIVGSAMQRGTNSWKVQEMIEGVQTGNYAEGASNELILASAEAQDLILMPTSEANRIRNLIDAVNRDALNQLYDDYGVDYSMATVWEKTEGDYHQRLTIYPSVSAQISFFERHLNRIDETAMATKSPVEVGIVVGSPANPANKGFSPAI